MSSSSSMALTSFSTLHIPWHHKIKTPSQLFNNNYYLVSKKPTSSHICFTFSGPEYEREERRWVREEERWLREEQRWIREERRWQSERESLLNQIRDLNLQIEQLKNDNNSVGNLLRVLKKKEAGRIAATGSGASPWVVEAGSASTEDVEEAVIKEVVRIVDEVKVEEIKEVIDDKKWTMLRAGSEGDQVQMLQEALLKLGFYCGEEDEEFSSFASGTERAVKTWQSSIGVPETGVMTAELLERLFVEQQEKISGFKEGANGIAVTSVTEVPESPSKTVKEDSKPYVSDNRVFLLGENRWEDSSRLKNRNSQTQTQTDSKGVVTTKCITCRGVGHLLCLDCDGTGEPNIEPQFLEWVGEDTKCPYCEGQGHTTCDVCEGTGVGAA